MDSFIDLVGQNWPRNAGPRTPLHQTVIQRGLPPRWPQLSQIAWFSEKNYIFHDKEAFSDNNVYILHLDSDYFIVVYNSQVHVEATVFGYGIEQTARANQKPFVDIARTNHRMFLT